MQLTKEPSELSLLPILMDFRYIIGNIIKRKNILDSYFFKGLPQGLGKLKLLENNRLLILTNIFEKNYKVYEKMSYTKVL